MNRVWVYKQVILVITSPSKQLYSWQEGDLYIWNVHISGTKLSSAVAYNANYMLLW